MSIIKKIVFALLILSTIFILWINVALYTNTSDTVHSKQDIKLQLNFLNEELKNNNLGNRMQELFPEGFIFTNALFGLSWCELGLADTSKQLKAQALKEALYAYEQINTNEAKSIFNTNLKPENGIYCVGWNNYLLSKILMLDTNFENSRIYKKIYINQCEEIMDALQHANTPYLESYAGQSWPADMCVAVASVSNYDKVFKPKYQHVISDWVTKVKSRLDPKTLLIPH
ncbi:MAG: hypothetical protein HYZ42_02445, partial [Bacteroidetes bacterium]|nr:hypothetical protein [Bacteroidota bacterium]